MRKITFSQATQEAMAETMAKDPTVFAMGEDLARQGGIFGQFKGLPQQFPGRLIDTPISETFIIGGGVGAALAGARPVVDMHFADFIGVPMDEIFNQMAKVRYMFGGQAKVPLVLRAPDGSAGGGAADLLAKEGIEAEVIDLITLSPWDKETVLNSVKKTHRLCIVHEAVKQGGFGAEISATVAEEAMEYLDAPILRYGAPFCPIPFAPTLEKMVKVVPEYLVKGIKGMF